MRALFTVLFITGCGLDTWGSGKGGPSPVDDSAASFHDTASFQDDTGLTHDTGFNQAPVADAGPDQLASYSAIVTLDGGGSYDPDGDGLIYLWQMVHQPSGSGTTLLADDRMSPTFVADATGDFVISLVVSDGVYDSAEDQVTVTVDAPNDVPIANAGSDQTVTVGSTVRLDGSGSSDPEGDPLSYSWSLITSPAGSGATLSSPSSANPMFTASVAGTYTAELTVSDGTNTSSADSVRVVASEDSGGGSNCLGCARSAEVGFKQRLGGVVLFGLLLGWRRRRPE